MNDVIARLRAWFDDLEPRERNLVIAAGSLIALVLGWLLVISPLIGILSSSGSRREVADQELRAMQRLEREFQSVNQRLASVEERIRSAPQGNLRTTLENLATEAAVKIESMEPQASPAHESYKETKVEVALKSVSLAQTVTLLTEIESATQVLSVKSLRIRKRPTPSDLLDVSFTVSSFETL